MLVAKNVKNDKKYKGYLLNVMVFMQFLRHYCMDQVQRVSIDLRLTATPLQLFES